MTQQENNIKAILGLIAIIGSIVFVWWCFSGADCIRTIPDGSVRCECDFKSSSDWQDFKESTHGTWEAVALDSDPCAK